MTVLRPAAVAARPLSWAVLAVAAVAWIALAQPGHHQPAGHLGHGLATSGTVGGWALMVVAMMLPPALPMLGVLRTLVGRRRFPAALVGLGAAVYVGLWTVVGAPPGETAEGVRATGQMAELVERCFPIPLPAWDVNAI